jgi:hypothetical protein
MRHTRKPNVPAAYAFFPDDIARIPSSDVKPLFPQTGKRLEVSPPVDPNVQPLFPPDEPDPFTEQRLA